MANEPVRSRIGGNIRSARIHKRLTLKQVSESAGMTRQHLSLIERGELNCTLDTMIAISRALDEPLCHFFKENV